MDSKEIMAQRLALADKKVKILVNLSVEKIFEYNIQLDTMYFYNETTNAGDKKVIFNFIASDYLNKGIHPDDVGKVKDLYEQLVSGKQFINQRYRKLDDKGQYRLIEISGQTIYEDSEGMQIAVLGKIGIANTTDNIYNTNLKGYDSELDIGIYNKSTIMDLIGEDIEVSDFTKENYLVLLDCSNFIEANETLSTTLRQSYAEELSECFCGYCIGRFDKNQFILYIPECSIDTILKTVERIDTNMNLVYVNSFKELKLKTQVGFALINEEGSLQENVHNCHSALEYGKVHNEKGYCVFEAGIIPLLPGVETKTNGQYTSKKSLHEKEEDLIYFTMELTEQVEDSTSVIRILSEKLSRLYHINNFAYFAIANEEVLNIRYIWDKTYKGKFVNNTVDFDVDVRTIINDKYDNQGIAIFGEDENIAYHKQVKSAICIRLDDISGEHFLVFYDYKSNRNWDVEKENLRKLSWIMHRRMKRLEDENRKTRELNYQLEHDDKTDVYKYSHFLDIVSDYVKNNSKRQFVLIYSDFSNFQFLNETYGYITGDKVLAEFAELLKEQSVKGNMCARVTGDHFISLREYSDTVLKEYEDFCKQFSAKINARYELCNLILVSGMSFIDNVKARMAFFVDNANIARKIAKKKQVTNCILYAEGMRTDTKVQMDLIANMEKALENHEFKMYLQPKIDLVTGEVSGAEALVRWIKDDGEMVYPDEFIPLFEDNGFVTKVDFEIFKQVLMFQKEVIEAGLPIMPISVNFSRRHQENPAYVEKVYDLMEQYEIPAEAIEIEITESVFEQDLTRLTENINKLKEKGVKIAIDDFGSGYSSLNVVTVVNADVIKLDREFILDIQKLKMTSHVEFLKTLVIMLKQLGFHVLAEGVETKEQEMMLRSIGCEYAQGYLYARPMIPQNYKQFASSFISKFE